MKLAKFILDFATFLGYNVVSRPFFQENGPLKNASHSERLEVNINFTQFLKFGSSQLKPKFSPILEILIDNFIFRIITKVVAC